MSSRLQVTRVQVSFKKRMQNIWVCALWSLRKWTNIVSLGGEAMLEWPDSIYHLLQYLSAYQPSQMCWGSCCCSDNSKRNMSKMLPEEEPRATSSFLAQCDTHTGSSLSPSTSQLLSFVPQCPRLQLSLGCVKESHWDPLGTLSAEELQRPKFLCWAACEESCTFTWEGNQLSYLSKWNNKLENRRAYFAVTGYPHYHCRVSKL